jgi:hypothetical protein
LVVHGDPCDPPPLFASTKKNSEKNVNLRPWFSKFSIRILENKQKKRLSDQKKPELGPVL